jgi:hypothetical protein
METAAIVLLTALAMVMAFRLKSVGFNAKFGNSNELLRSENKPAEPKSVPGGEENNQLR